MRITPIKLIEPFALCSLEPPFPLKCKLLYLLLFVYSIKTTRFLCQKDDMHGIMIMTCWIKYWETDLIFSRDYCWRFWSSEIFYMPWAEIEFRLFWLKLCCINDHYTTVTLYKGAEEGNQRYIWKLLHIFFDDSLSRFYIWQMTGNSSPSGFVVRYYVLW